MQQVERRVGLESFIISLGSRLLKEMPFTVGFKELLEVKSCVNKVMLVFVDEIRPFPTSLLR